MKVSYCSALDRFEQTLHLVWVYLWSFFKMQVNVHCGIGSIPMPIAWHIQNASATSLQRTAVKNT